MPNAHDPDDANHPVDADPGRPAPDSVEARVEQAMELYLNQLEAGTAPGRATFLKQFPDLADELSGQLETLDFLHIASPEVQGRTVDHPGTPSAPFEKPATLGDFRLLRQIGRGGMGIVYEAIQLSLDRRVAVKVLPFAAMIDAKQRKRFKNEARAAATLDHPNIVPIYFVGQERGVHFYAMQLIEGPSLHDVIGESNPMDVSLTQDGIVASRMSRLSMANATSPTHPPSIHATIRTNQTNQPTSATPLSTQRDQSMDQYVRSVAGLGIQVARALQHAHEQGIVHRDIKPGNLLLDDTGKVWITDFGLARFEANDSITGHGDVLGTAAYMSPEQVSGSSLVDARSDVYSLAVTLYELLALQRPFNSVQEENRTAGRSAPAQPLKTLNRRIPTDLETIVGKAMEEAPTDRYQSAGALADDLQRFVSGHSIQARRPSMSDQTLKWIGRHKRFAASLSVATMLLCAVLFVSTVVVWRARDLAGKALSQSEQHADRIQDLLYLSDMQIAYQAWDNEQPTRVNEILRRYIPKPGMSDRRGYEWFALHTLTRHLEPKIVGRHEGAANQLSVFPEGRRVASVGDDQKLRIWDLESKQPLLIVDMGDSSIEPLFSVAISPDGQTVATGSDCVQLWDAETGQRQRLLTSYNRNVQSIAFSSDGERIATAARYDQVRMFSSDGELLNTIEGRSRHESLEFTPDSQRLLVPSRRAIPGGNQREGFIRVWSSDLAQIDMDLAPGLDENINYTVATCSSDGLFFAISEQTALRNPVRLVDAKTGRELLQLEQKADEVQSIAIAPDNQTLAVGYKDGHIAVWNLGRTPAGALSAPSRVRTLHAHDGELTAVRFAGPRQLLSCGRDGYVKLWYLPTVENPEMLQPEFVSNLVFSPDYRLMGMHSNGRFHLWDFQLGTILDERCEYGTRVSFSRDAKLVATAYQNDNQNTLAVWEAKTGSRVRSISGAVPFSDLGFSPVNDHLACLDREGKITIWSTSQWETVAEQSLFNELDFRDYRCRYGPDGRYLLCSGRHELVVVDAKTMDSTRRIRMPSWVRRFSFNQAKSLVAAARGDGVIQLWEWPSLAPFGTLNGHVGPVNDLRFTTQDRLLSVGDDGTTRVWSARDLREFGVLLRRDYPPTCLSLNPDGQIYVGYNTLKTGEPGLSILRIDPVPGTGAPPLPQP